MLFKNDSSLVDFLMDHANKALVLSAENRQLLSSSDWGYACDGTVDGLWEYLKEDYADLHTKIVGGGAFEVSEEVLVDLKDTTAGSLKWHLETFADQNADALAEEEKSFSGIGEEGP